MESNTHRTEAASVPQSAFARAIEDDVRDAIAASPRGQEIACYFGIGGGAAEQPEEERSEAESLIAELRTNVRAGMSLEHLLPRIEAHCKSCGVAPESLRTLIYRRR